MESSNEIPIETPHRCGNKSTAASGECGGRIFHPLYGEHRKRNCGHIPSSVAFIIGRVVPHRSSEKERSRSGHENAPTNVEGLAGYRRRLAPG